MASLLTDKFIRNEFRIGQSVGRPTAQQLAACDHLLLILPHKPAASTWRKVPGGSRLQGLLRRRKRGSVPAFSSRLNNKRQTAVHVATIKPTDDAFRRLSSARRLVAAALSEKPGVLGIWVLGLDGDEQTQWVNDVTAAALAAGFPMPTFKTEPPPPAIRSLKIFGLDEKLDLRRRQAEAKGNDLARWLTALPANALDAQEYVRVLRDLARENNWQFKKYGVGELEKMGAGAFLAVAQGNADDSAAIVRLRYRPKHAPKIKPIALVGKGIVFDTGGTNLKPFMSMLDMHIDMGGSAVAAGTLLALSDLDVTATDRLLARDYREPDRPDGLQITGHRHSSQWQDDTNHSHGC